MLAIALPANRAFFAELWLLVNVHFKHV